MAAIPSTSTVTKLAMPPSMPPVVKGMLARIRKGAIAGKLNFQFNPNSVKRTGAVDWQWGQGPGGVFPVATFGKIGEFGFSFELLFDARETFQDDEQGLRGVLSECESMVLPSLELWQADRSKLAKSPDLCRLVLGQRCWPCMCVSVNITEEAWNYKLDPVRARVEFNLRLVNVGVDQVKKYLDEIRKFRNQYECV